VKRLVVISGKSASGKTTLARKLAKENNWYHIEFDICYLYMGKKLGKTLDDVRMMNNRHKKDFLLMQKLCSQEYETIIIEGETLVNYEERKKLYKFFKATQAKHIELKPKNWEEMSVKKWGYVRDKEYLDWYKSIKMSK
jgi:cytidylate kinase